MPEDAMPHPVRAACWIAGAMGAICLMGMWVNTTLGLLQALLFFAVAWGIRRRHAWAAAAGMCVVAAPVLSTALRWRNWDPQLQGEWVGMAVSAVLLLVVFAVLLRAAITLWRRPAPRWPWLALIGILAAGYLCFQPMMVPTVAMEETILTGDQLLTETVTTRLGRVPQRGEVVVFIYPVDRRQTFIKRVVGVPGDRIRIANKQLIRNGAPAPEPYAVHRTAYVDSYRDNFPSQPTTKLFPQALEMLGRHVRNGEVVVPEGKYFVLGDNRDSSLDSRYWGFIDASDVISRPLLVYQSNQVEDGAMPSFGNLRWNRMFKWL